MQVDVSRDTSVQVDVSREISLTQTSSARTTDNDDNDDDNDDNDDDDDDELEHTQTSNRTTASPWTTLIPSLNQQAQTPTAPEKTLDEDNGDDTNGSK